MNVDYWRGFRDGQEHERKKAAKVLAFYIESLKTARKMYHNASEEDKLGGEEE